MKPRIHHRHGFEVLREAIPDHHEDIAALLGVSLGQVYRWQSPPESNDEPLANGRRSPLDRMLDLLSAVYVTNPAGAPLLVDAVAARLDELRRTHHRAEWDALQTLEDVLNGTACVLHELRDGQPTDRDVKAMLKLRTTLDEAIAHAHAAVEDGRGRR